MNSPPSPSPARWFKLRRTRFGEPCLKTYTLESVDLLRRARVAFQNGRTLKEVFRLTQLEAVVRFLEEHECDFVEALARDLHKPRFETVLSELTVVKNEARHAINNLKKWMKPQYMEKNLSTTMDECLVVSEPLGVVFIIGTWCSPIQMCLVPLVGAIAAGVNDLPKVVELKFDHVFFSGNREDGSRIAQAAARTLTPVTLILSGKNPCYVDQQCEIATTAQRIAWARFHNAGQSLVAPDYVLCHADVKAQLVEALKYYLMQFYGCDPRESCSYGRMVNLELFNRTRDMLWRSGKVVVGGQVISRLMSETSSGSFCANDSILQSLMVALPFGGVGASGMGSYHGRYSFDTFSHRKSCLLRSTRFECVTYLRYPPYEDRNLSLMTWASTVSQKSQGWCQIL
ncbi:Aldehyde dehydrogenase family 3 member B1 [Larimichthys crocea]|uniref:Aldehyde dehydrogenase n=1 Tax=Larimichthys crocea TaxID=215358 RepID=A0A6G0ILB9_LARCR|nr:Aldehyde dehydrogenase family 3 member B1 [Larimichthys crocea]